MKIAILGAMQEEVEPLLAYFKNIKEIKLAGNIYYLADYKNHQLVIAYSKIGKVFASLSATMMLEHFGAEILLFSGVAGGINKNLKIGDLIYATKLAQHDLDITAFGHPFGYVPEGKVFVETDNKLNQIAKDVADELSLKLQGGVIATGDQFVNSNERKEWIEKTFNADALEMEGASVAVVCDSMNIPFFVLRAISDEADGNADFDFDTFLDSSAKISADFLIKMVDKI